MKRLRAAIYARVSTHEGKQHLENQIARCVEFIERSDDLQPAPLAAQYIDEESGASTRNRPALRHMLSDAAARHFDVLVVFDLSRLTREGPAKAFELIARLKHCGCEFVSVNEPHFRTTGFAGEMLIAIAAYVASEERRIIRARIQAGIDRAKREGKILGRPADQIDPAHLLRLVKEGLSLRQMALALKCSKSTIERRIKRDPQTFSRTPEVRER